MSGDQVVIGRGVGAYYAAPGRGVVRRLADAHVYTRNEAQALLGDCLGAEIMALPRVAGIDEISQLRRQNADLQAANNRLLERARKAESQQRTAEAPCRQYVPVDTSSFTTRISYLETSLSFQMDRAEHAEAELKSLTRTLGGVVRGERIPIGETQFKTAA